MRVVRADFPDFRREQLRLEKLFNGLPTWAGNAALNHYKESFRRQGFTDVAFERWPQRNDALKRAILIKSGSLRRSLRLQTGAGWFEVFTDSPYAKAHNEGATITQKVTARQRAYFWAMYYKFAKKAERSRRKNVKGYAGWATNAEDQTAEMWKRMALSKTLTIKVPRRQFMDVPGTRPSAFLERRIVMHVERALEAALAGAG